MIFLPSDRERWADEQETPKRKKQHFSSRLRAYTTKSAWTASFLGPFMATHINDNINKIFTINTKHDFTRSKISYLGLGHEELMRS